MNRKQTIVSFIGTDGSGKTTTSESCKRKLVSKGFVVDSVWCGAESYLMKPLRWFLALFTRGRASRGKDEALYVDEVSKKNRLAGSSELARRVYVFLVLLDYRVQYLFRMWRYRKSEILILDRYYFDVFVNLAITLGWSPSELICQVKKHFHKYKFPEVRAFVFVPPEVSMSRKDDIPDIGYVEIRLSYYRALADEFGFFEIDGESSVFENTEYICQQVQESVDSTHIHYVHSNNEDVGGADFCLVRMAEAVSLSQGFRVSASLRSSTSVVDGYRQAGVPLYINNFCRPQLSQGVLAILTLPFKGLYTIYYFILLFRSIRPDVVHVNDLYDFFPAISAKLLGIPVAYHIRMIRVNALERRVFSIIVSRLSRVSLSVSQAVREAYFSKKFYKGHHPIVLHDWPDQRLVDLSESNEKPNEYAPYDLVVVMVGRVEWWKGQHVFLDAVEKLEKQYENVGYFIVGGDVLGADKVRYSKVIRDRCSELGVQFLGHRSDVSQLLRHADISVHASVTPDPFPGVVLESLLSGCATIGANAGGVAEMIEQSVGGMKFQPGDSDQLSSLIGGLIVNDVQRKSLGVNGRRRILDLTCKKRILEETLDIYKQLTVKL